MTRDRFDKMVMEAQHRFDQWSKEAKPVFERIFKEFPQQLNGLQYRADRPNSDESGFQIVTLTTNTDGTYSRKYFDDVYKEEVKGLEIFTNIPHQIIYHLKQAYDCSAFPRVDNPRRNRLLAELQRRTGVNVKKEIKSRLTR